jgi:hypothetical protein
MSEQLHNMLVVAAELDRDPAFARAVTQALGRPTVQQTVPLTPAVLSL